MSILKSACSRWKWITITILAPAAVVSLSYAGVSWIGTASYGGATYFVLRNDDTGKAAWVKEGGVFDKLEVREYDKIGQTLDIFDVSTKSPIRLTLRASHISTQGETNRVEPLSKNDSLSLIRNLLEMIQHGSGREVAYEQLPPEVRKAVDEMAKHPVPLPPNTPDKMTDVQKLEYKQTLASQGLLIVDESTIDGHNQTTLLRPLKLDDLPSFLVGNITQGDLDDLVVSQSRAATAGVPASMSEQNQDPKIEH